MQDLLSPQLGPASKTEPLAPERVRHLNQKQLAFRWGLSVRSLERWRRKGLGPLFLKLNGRVTYRLADVEDFEAERVKMSTVEVVA